MTSDEECDDARYSLDRSYGGDARRTIRRTFKSGGGSKRRRYGRNAGHSTKINQGKRLNSLWIRGVKGYFVCGQDHRANTRHSHDEVTKSINKLKEGNPTALLTVDDLQSVVNLTMEERGQEEEKDGILWNEDEYEEVDTDLVLMAAPDLKSVEKLLGYNAFIDGYSTGNKLDDILPACLSFTYVTEPETTLFKGINIDTASNRKSIMSESHYIAYQEELGRMVPMRPQSATLR